MKNKSQFLRERRHRRLRKKVIGTSQRPRLAVHRSHKNLFTQIVDDIAGKTLLSASTIEKDFAKKQKYGGNVKAAALLGEFLAGKAKEKGIKKVVFDRGGYKFHGRIKALAESARKAGLEF